jgi:hypothetical protein
MFPLKCLKVSSIVNEELHKLCSSPCVISMQDLNLFLGMIKLRKMRWVGNVERMWKKRNAYRILLGEPEGKRPLGRPRCR